jgi:hypothetical protein
MDKVTWLIIVGITSYIATIIITNDIRTRVINNIERDFKTL